MVSLIVFFAVLISGGMLGATYGKRFEECMPVQLLGIVILLYLFGLGGFVKSGVYFILIASALLLIGSTVRCIKNSERRTILHCFFTPGFFIFTLLYVSLIYFNLGRVSYYTDEFSHWIDSIKVMSIYDEFIIVSNSDSAFKSYPPGITLFQYFLQKIYELEGNQDFSEWRCYVAYQLFGISMFLPCFKRVKEFNIVQILLYVTAYIVLPLLFFQYYYSFVFADPLIGLLAGSAFYLLLFEEKDEFTFVHICMLSVVLVLLKDIGILFALFIDIAWVLDRFPFQSEKKGAEVFGKISWSKKLLPLSFSLITFASWKAMLKFYHTPIKFGNHIDLIEYTKLFAGGSTENIFRQTVVDTFKHAFFEGRFRIGDSGYKISCAVCFFALTALSFITIVKYSKLHKASKKRNLLIWLLMVLLAAIYIYSLGAVYCYNFTEWEALTLASYARYLGMPFLMIWSVVVWGTILLIEEGLRDVKLSNVSVLLLAFILSVSPLSMFINVIKGETRAYSLEHRSRYINISNLIMDHCSRDDHIYFISQEHDNGDFLVTAFLIRPYHLGGNWNIGSQLYEDDASANNVSVDEFKRDLYQNYDYLAIYHMNSCFADTFGELFEDKATIKECALYRVDKSRGESGIRLCFVSSGETE